MKNVKTLQKYISSLKNDVKETCVCNKKYFKYFNSHGQDVKVCNKNTVIKGSKKISKNRIEKINNLPLIKLDRFTINLLIQTIIKKYYDKGLIDLHNMEHYNKLCINDGKVKFISKRSNYPNYDTLQEYIIDSKDNFEDKIKFIEKCLIQVFKQLDRLYKDIQFHYCDPKSKQLFLFKTNNKTNNVTCMLSDLELVTFTILINGNPYRIRLTKDYKKHTLKGIFLSSLEKISFLDKITEMKYKSLPQKSNLFEKLVFISSCCILLNNKDYSIKLRKEMLDFIFKSYNINIDESTYKKIIKLEYYYKKSFGIFNKKTSFYVATKYINYKYLLKIPEIKHLLSDENNLKSVINLLSDENNLKPKLILKNNNTGKIN